MTRAGWAVLAAAILIAVLRASFADGPEQKRALTDRELREVGRAAAAKEPEWRLKSRQSFPYDRWSQDDDFANAERSWVRNEATRRGVAETEIWRAIDVDLRRHPVKPPRSATSAPSKPRSWYD